MAKATAPRDPVTVVIPVHNAADRLEKLVPAWAEALVRLGREYEILVVDDGSTDTTPAVLEKLAAGRVRHLRILKHEARRGFGACLRTALPEVKHPLLCYTATDYPYTPSDLRRMLERIEVRDEIFGKQPDLISGCRTGLPAPAVLTGLGRCWRLFWRVVVGLQIQPAPSWLGWREWRQGTVGSWLFGIPLSDVNSAFKLYRTAFLKRVPIQSDGDFVHAELVAKATFLTSIMDEIPLTAKPDAVPATRWSDMGRVFSNPDFGIGATAVSGEPGAPPGPGQAAVEDSRSLASPPAPPDTPASPQPLTFAPVV